MKRMFRFFLFFCAISIVSGFDQADSAVTLNNFAITSGTYAETDNLEQSIRNQFGSNYRIADWNDIIAYNNNGGNAVAFEAALAQGAYITYNGSRWSTSTRHYLYTISHRPGQTPHDGYLSHANIDNHEWDLGSWYGQNRVLAYTDNPSTGADSCGAYLARGVWKEFDCYNLAAIGKNTGDDPFTPSWRLIGGYWQWGRKGPDPSKWYDTNTSNFAHGPTGPSSGGANSGSISGWDETDAPDGSWSKGSQAVYYLLDQEADLNKTDADGDGKVDLLLNLNTNGFRFRVDNGVELSISFDKTLLLSPAEPYQTGKVITHADFVAALQPGLAQLIAEGSVPADTTLFLDSNLTVFTYLDDGSRSSDIPAMILRTHTDKILTAYGFLWVDDLDGDYNVYGRVSSEAEVSDPCPPGFRVPTKSQWGGVTNNNTQHVVGSWLNDATNYGSARFFGDDLMLPAAGYRFINGSLELRGRLGYYWSQTENKGNSNAWFLNFGNSEANAESLSIREFGLSVRCIADSETPPPCTYNLSRTNSSFNSGSESHSVSVTTSRSDCAWTTSNTLPWVSVSPSGGTGSRNVTVTVNPTSGAARNGSITIAGRTYTINQKGMNEIPVSGLTKTQVSQLYVSIFGRASEGEGNAYWKAHSDMANAVNSMLDTQAAKNYFGSNLNINQAFIEHIYLNTLNKTIADDPDGIHYWVRMLENGVSRGEAVATLVGAIKDYAPTGANYDPNDASTIAAYYQFINRVKVSDFMAQNIYDPPYDWEKSTAFNYDMIITDDPASVFSAIAIVNSYKNRTDDKKVLMAEFIKNKWPVAFMTNTTTDILYPKDIASAIDDIIITNVSQVQRNIGFEVIHNDDRLRIISKDSTGNDPVLLNIQIIGMDYNEYSFILPAHVLQVEKTWEETVQPFSKIGINFDNITIHPDYSSFSEPTLITTYKLHNSIKDFFVSGDVLDTYSIQVERQPEKPVSIKYKINFNQNPDDIIMAHMNSVGEIEFIYPDDYDSHSNELLFKLDSFCELSFFSKEDFYDLNYTFSIKDIEQNPKEVFNYIAQLIDYIGNDLKIQRVFYSKQEGKFAAILLSEAIHSFVKIAINENSYTQLNPITYPKNVFNIFGTEASETLIELYEKFTRVMSKISLSAGSSKIDYDELNGYLHDNGWIEDEISWLPWLEWGPFKNNNSMDQLFYAEVIDYYMFLPIDIDKDIPNFISSLKSAGLNDLQIIQALDKIKGYWIAKTSILYPLDVIKACLVNETSDLISDVLIDGYIWLYPQLIPFWGKCLSTLNDSLTLSNITEEYYLKYMTQLSQSAWNYFLNEEGWTDLYISMPNCTQNPNITVRVLEDFKKRLEKIDYFISNLSTDSDNEGDDVPPTDDGNSDGGQDTPPTDDGNSDGGQDTPPTDDNDPQPDIVAEPFFSHNSGTYDHLLHIEISTTTPDAIVRYTTDGNDPSLLSGTIYTNPILITSKTTIKAIAYIPNKNQSELTSATFDISGADINCKNIYFDGCMELSTFSMFSVKQGESIYFEAGVNGGKSPYEFHWAFDYDNYSRQESLEYTFRHPGNKIATLTITDKNNNFAKESINVYVSKYLKGNILLPSSITVGEEVTFKAEVAGGIDEYLYDYEPYPYEYNWDFGDGKYSNNKEPIHTYTSAGKYTVRLTIKDLRGDTIGDVKEVIVSENDNTPNGNFLIGTWLVTINYITLNGQKYTEVVDANGIIYSVEDFYSNVVIFNNGTLNYSDYLWGSYQTSGSGGWTYDESTGYFKASADGDLVSGKITGTINNFEVAGTYEGLSVSYQFKKQ